MWTRLLNIANVLQVVNFLKSNNQSGLKGNYQDVNMSNGQPVIDLSVQNTDNMKQVSATTVAVITISLVALAFTVSKLTEK